MARQELEWNNADKVLVEGENGTFEVFANRDIKELLDMLSNISRRLR
jgi:hypothetical protein